MRWDLRLFFGAIGILIFGFIIKLVRDRKLKEEYSLLWLILGFIFFIISLFPNLISFLNNLIGISNPVYTLFFGAIIFLVIYSAHISIKISTYEDKIKNLAQELSILKNEIRSDRELEVKNV
ncbi:DUF2304 domain-containing protein [Haliovirga abyssi]|uniref:DUF2304 domain-containing protein n=1 Tax=Haliovirga abyssi TaxID=2996794 RepID=A0AAU9DCS1_9FUSO|nr:DUF2304 domain-containing protein [Haliovirga abyssi]BDU51130.1 hypothetical protein HLVA_16990 [Haliovirga abyssi]